MIAIAENLVIPDTPTVTSLPRVLSLYFDATHDYGVSAFHASLFDYMKTNMR